MTREELEKAIVAALNRCSTPARFAARWDPNSAAREKRNLTRAQLAGLQTSRSRDGRIERGTSEINSGHGPPVPRLNTTSAN